jgi:hypothetical protein
MKKAVILIFIIIVSFVWADSQITFIKAYGADKNEYSYGVEETSDGGYILIGHSFSSSIGYSSLYLVKTDAYGNELWHKVFYGASNDERPVVQQTQDGGYIILEYSSTEHPVSRVWLDDALLIKTDSSGNELWRNTYGGEDLALERLHIEETADRGFIISGCILDINENGSRPGYYEGYLIKLDSEGNEIWSNRFGVNDLHLYIRHVEQATDGGYIVCGFIAYPNPKGYLSTANDDIYLAKTDSYGNLLWEKIIDYKDVDYAYCAEQTSDGGYILTGETRVALDGSREDFDIILIKTDSAGNETWLKTFNIDNYDIAAYVEQTLDGGYIITGRTSDNVVGGFGGCLIKTDANGNEIWTKTYHDYVSGYVYVGHQTSDGGYIFTGTTRTIGAGGLDAFIVKTDSEGNVY